MAAMAKLQLPPPVVEATEILPAGVPIPRSLQLPRGQQHRPPPSPYSADQIDFTGLVMGATTGALSSALRGRSAEDVVTDALLGGLVGLLVGATVRRLPSA